MAERKDPLIEWARQGDRDGVRVWRAGGAEVVACRDLARRDRVAVRGEVDALVPLLSEALAVLGPTYRVLGDEALISAVAARLPGLASVGRFGWMDVTVPAAAGAGEWLDPPDEVEGLLREAFPASYAWPGGTGVRRWAGLRRDGRLLATAADAWSVPAVGFLAGVATHPDARGRGLGGQVCGFVTSELLREHPRVALFVDYWNVAALRTYRGLGFTLRPLAVAASAQTIE